MIIDNPYVEKETRLMLAYDENPTPELKVKLELASRQSLEYALQKMQESKKRQSKLEDVGR